MSEVEAEYLQRATDLRVQMWRNEIARVQLSLTMALTEVERAAAECLPEAAAPAAGARRLANATAEILQLTQRLETLRNAETYVTV